MIDVIIPVYKGLQQTRRCIESVLASRQAAPFEIVTVDDASPEAGITSYLDELAAARRIVLVRNERNLGFVQSVNRGMSLHSDRDVVLLNSDTEVANDWLDRLLKSAYAYPDVGTVTPFSNNATICSYPFEGWTGGVPGTLALADLDRLFASTNAGRTVDLPTAVGFCMLIRRACLDQVGAFDAERFGRGYGEENDFCMRASGVGWRNVLAGDVFVYHEGA
jgi:GT2 family glycosyltransferase